MMGRQHLSSKHISTAMRNGIHSNALQVITKPKFESEEFIEKILNRRWTLPSPETKIHQVIHRHELHGRNYLLNTNPAFGDGTEVMDKRRKHFYVVRDDLLHPLINGNKARKLDGLLPLLQDYSVTDVVTCGGCQSAHTAAIGRQLSWSCCSVCRERNYVTSASTRRAA